MKLDYIQDIILDRNATAGEFDKIMRLYDFDHLQAQLFKDLIQASLSKNNFPIQLHQVEFIEPLNCTLTFRIADENLGITSEDLIHFYCDLTKEGYMEMISFVEPFCDDDSGYQWLYNVNTPIDFLFSPGGSW
ncbi:MAG: hypothetical protein HYZ42_05010 [Bacteroidetes bacterium]|nr:hypothetical protein [Bacteroidota bacterium]